jgi:hypothetical protein
VRRKTDPKPFEWKVARPTRQDRPLDRLEIEPEKEVLTGLVMGEQASDLEERLYTALGEKFGFGNVEFQPSYLGIKNLTEVRPDFAVHGGSRIVIVYADDEFTHGSAEQKQKDKMNDARLMAQMGGYIEPPVHIMGVELKSNADARAAVEARW